MFFVLKILTKYGKVVWILFQSRCSPDAFKDIVNSLEWAGIVPNEGPSIGGPNGPYVQVRRMNYYVFFIGDL